MSCSSKRKIEVGSCISTFVSSTKMRRSDLTLRLFSIAAASGRTLPVTMLSLPASILGNEAALKYGRHRAITIVMLSSAVVAGAIGFTAGVSPWLSLFLLLCYALTVPADSGALTSGMSGAAEQRYRGATLALHSTVGFGLSAVGGWAVGAAIDAAGGPASEAGWLAAFLVMGAGILFGPLALWWSRR